MQVYTISAAQAVGSRSRISQWHREQRAPPCHVNEPLRAGLLQGALHPHPGSHHSLHPLVGVLQQGLHTRVGLGESERLLARGRAHLHRRRHTERLQHQSEFRVGHQVFLGDACVGQQFFLAPHHIGKVLLQLLHVQAQRGLGVHPDEPIDQLQFLARVGVSVVERLRLVPPVGHQEEQFMA